MPILLRGTTQPTEPVAYRPKGDTLWAMGATTEENRVAALEAELTALRKELEALRRKSHQQSTDAADAALESTRRENRHDREMASERGRTVAAEGRADRAETRHADLSATHELLLKSSEINRIILQTMTDRVSLLDLDGRIEFMNAGGQRAIEIDNFSQVAGHLWIDLWQGDERVKAGEAVEAAKAFTGTCRPNSDQNSRRITK